MSAAAEMLELPFEVRSPRPGWGKGSERCYIIDSWLKSAVAVRGKMKRNDRHELFRWLRALYSGYLDSAYTLKLVAVDPGSTLVVGWFIRVPPPPGHQGPVMEAWHTKSWAEPFEGLILHVMREAADMVSPRKEKP